MAPYRIRPAKAEDLPFLLNSWLKRYRDAISARLVTDKVYYKVQHDVISKILSRSDTVEIRVACNPEDEDQIYGYCVSEVWPNLPITLLHWVYVKGPLRRYGIANTLIQDALHRKDDKVHYTHKTHLIDFLDKEKKWLFNATYVWQLL